MKIEFRMKYIQHWTDHLGRQRYRIRRKGFPRIELPVDGNPSSPEFQAAYHAALRGENLKQAIANVTIKSGTLANALHRYLNSATFHNLADSTQALRRTLLKCFTQPAVGNIDLAQVDAAYVARWIDENAKTLGVKRTRFLAIRPFLAWATEVKLIPANPTDGMKVKIVEGDGHHTWTDEEIAQYRAAHALGTMARLAFELLLNIGARSGDGITLGRQHIKTENGQRWLVYTQEKNRKRKPSKVEVPIMPELAQALAACPGADDTLTFIANEWNKPFAKKGFNSWWRRQVEAAGLKPDVHHAHGLRKACGRLMAENGCTAHEIMAVLGHRTLAEAERYCRMFNRKQAAERGLAKLGKANNVVPLAAVS